MRAVHSGANPCASIPQPGMGRARFVRARVGQAKHVDAPPHPPSQTPKRALWMHTLPARVAGVIGCLTRLRHLFLLLTLTLPRRMLVYNRAGRPHDHRDAVDVLRRCRQSCPSLRLDFCRQCACTQDTIAKAPVSHAREQQQQQQLGSRDADQGDAQPATSADDREPLQRPVW